MTEFEGDIFKCGVRMARLISVLLYAVFAIPRSRVSKKPSIQASVALTTSSFHIKHAHFTSLRKRSRHAEIILFVSQKPQTSDWV